MSVVVGVNKENDNQADNAGNPFYYVMAEIMRQRFVPELQVSADYDVEWYREISKDVRYHAFFSQCPENQLPELAVEAALRCDRIYHWNCG